MKTVKKVLSNTGNNGKTVVPEPPKFVEHKCERPGQPIVVKPIINVTDRKKKWVARLKIKGGLRLEIEEV